MNLKEAHALFYGGADGFWKDTVFSLINETMYNHVFMSKLRNVMQEIHLKRMTVGL